MITLQNKSIEILPSSRSRKFKSVEELQLESFDDFVEAEVDKAEIEKEIIAARLKGAPVLTLARQYEVEPLEIFELEEAYWSKVDKPSPHAMFLKQLTRLEEMIDALWDSAKLTGNPKVVEQVISAINSISDIAGLKKTRIEAEIRVIEEREVVLVQSFVEAVLANFLELLAKEVPEVRPVVEKNYLDWLVQATKDPTQVISSETAKIEM